MQHHSWMKRHSHHARSTVERGVPMALSEMTAGQEGAVLAFQGGRMVKTRLASLGFTPGVQIRMVQNYGHGPLIVLVRGTRVALGRGEAARILVRLGADE